MKTIFIYCLFFLCALSAVSLVSAAEKAKLKVDPTFSELLQELSSLQDIASRRDLFQRQIPDLLNVVQEEITTVPLSTSELERYPTTQYKANAVLVGDGVPRALVRTPENKFLIVREKDKIGNKKGYVKKIDSEGILVMENRSEVLLAVAGDIKK